MTNPIPESPSLTHVAGAISMVENPHLVRLTAKDLVIETPMTYTHKRVVMSGSGACDPKWPRTDQTRRSDGRKVEALSDVGSTVRQASEVSRQATSDSSVQLLQQHAARISFPLDDQMPRAREVEQDHVSTASTSAEERKDGPTVQSRDRRRKLSQGHDQGQSAWGARLASRKVQ